MTWSEHDVQYALESTQILHEPDRRIDTFGTTRFEFQLLSEVMDRADQVRVRAGKIQAEKPLIFRPEALSDFEFEGFGEQAAAFAHWLRSHAGQLPPVFQYGFSFRKSDVTEHLVHESLPVVQGRLVEETMRSGNPLATVIVGVDDTWEISLLKFTVDMIIKSHSINKFDFRRRGLI